MDLTTDLHGLIHRFTQTNRHKDNLWQSLIQYL
jgi:hypothetical protein